eukprot:7420472-Ditylum_brightwellii.AAC.1
MVVASWWKVELKMANSFWTKISDPMGTPSMTKPSVVSPLVYLAMAVVSEARVVGSRMYGRIEVPDVL